MENWSSSLTLVCRLIQEYLCVRIRINVHHKSILFYFSQAHFLFHSIIYGYRNFSYCQITFFNDLISDGEPEKERLQGAGVGAGKVKPIQRSQEPGTGPFQRNSDPEPVKEIYEIGSQEPFRGSKAESREPVKKGTGSPTLKFSQIL